VHVPASPIEEGNCSRRKSWLPGRVLAGGGVDGIEHRTQRIHREGDPPHFWHSFQWAYRSNALLRAAGACREPQGASGSGSPRSLARMSNLLARLNKTGVAPPTFCNRPALHVRASPLDPRPWGLPMTTVPSNPLTPLSNGRCSMSTSGVRDLPCEWCKQGNGSTAKSKEMITSPHT
jgi:hypothetical protein